MPFEKLDILTPREAIIREIEERIIKGKLVVGEKLPTERELEAQTGISKSIIHFALKDLENMGFLKIIPRRGAYVADFSRTGSFNTLNELLRYNGGILSFKMSLEIVEFRNALQGAAMVKLAAEHSHKDMELLRAAVEELRTAKNKNVEIHEFADLESRFHLLICELGGNDILSLVMNSFISISKTLWQFCTMYWGFDGLIAHDEKIVDMLEQGAGREAQMYIEDILAKFLEAYRESL